MGNTDSKAVEIDPIFARERFCVPCISMFGTVEGLKALGSKKGYRYHGKHAMLAGMKNGCPLCKVLYPTWCSLPKNPGNEIDPEEDCVVRAVCAQKSPPSVQSEVKGYPLSILSIGFVFSNVAFDERYLTIYQLPGDPSSKYLTGCLPQSYDMFGERHLQEAKRKLLDCLSKHASCPNTKIPPLPTTVLDIFHQNPKVHMSAPDERGDYVALSYCWGGPQVMTIKDTLQANMTGIALQTLSQTIQDAILVTRKLGIRYIWVDALCIVQDDETSKNKEISQMGRIYSNATLTISASSSAAATEGFLRKPCAPEGCELPFLLPDGKFGKVLAVPSQEQKDIAFSKMKEIKAYPVDYRDWTRQEQLAVDFAIQSPEGQRPAELGRPWPLDTRAWAFQEHMLSPRLLVFGPDDVRWRCQEIQLEPLFPNLTRYRGPAKRVPLISAPVYDSEFWTKERGVLSVWAMTTKQRELWTTVMVAFSSRFITVQ
ncbi:HET-domain-containing protein [Mytilinidion resinicola]|uniref:HET-domain-containing protein n=1 Tax=Mytilinidion resinicola TaxID=574789 RepID=A0A6A6YDS4_9PEZI|nr:HET-domain-containing protein [Mytilinidion resinicola]KAF2806749.1 HET-domain-containing protein [Mytilinidion resinicola]